LSEFYTALLDSFPHETIRESQDQIFRQLAATWDKFSVFIIDAPTGVGKSAIAYSLLKASGNGYLLTSTKVLQKQYRDEFPDINLIKGKSNYDCALNSDFNVADAPCNLRKQLMMKCRGSNICYYYNAKESAQKAPFVQTNYNYFIAAGMSDAHNEGESMWSKRKVMVCDEAHEFPDIASQIMSRDVDVTWLSKRFDVDLNDIEFEEGKRDENIECLRFILEVLERRQESINKTLRDTNKDAMEQANGDPEQINQHIAKRLRTLQKKSADIDDIVGSISNVLEKCLEDPNWVVEPINRQKLKMATIRPYEVFKYYVENKVDKLVFMSASMGDPEQFVEDLCIDPADVVIIDSDSPFDPELSPIIDRGGLDMSKKHIDLNIDKMLRLVDHIAAEYPDVKGIIHAGNYRVCKELLENSDYRLRTRLIGKAESNGQTNEDLIERHKRSTDPTILISPSMYTGVDLKDDDSRFQIIVKLPWGFLGDPVIRVRQGESYQWYVNEMFKKLIQASGRSTRTEDDYSVTYILDNGFTRVWNRNKQYLPEWFNKRVVRPSL